MPRSKIAFVIPAVLILLSPTAVFRDSVKATTLINGLKVEAGVSRPSVDGGLRLLLTLQHGTVAALIKANASNHSTAAKFHLDWTGASVIAVLSAPVALLIFLASRRAR
jgi:hypothetical protein